MNWRCMRCGKETPSKELVDYNIPDGTCGIFERVDLGTFLITVCKECNQEWVAVDRYLGETHWIQRKDEFTHYLLNFHTKSICDSG